MKTEKLEFTGHDGSLLAGRLDLPAGKPSSFALFAHCFTCSSDIAAARRVSRRLASLGIAVLRFDFTGLGESQGEFANTDFSSNVADLVSAANYLREYYQAPQLLIGHSLGGAAILVAAKSIAESRAVVTIGSPASPKMLSRHFNQHLAEIEQQGHAEVVLADRRFTITRSFIEDISRQSIEESVHHLKKALLVMHAPMDETVAIENAAELFRMAMHPKSFVTLDSADHLLSRAEDAEYAAEVITGWAQRYIDVQQLPLDTEAPEGITRVSEAAAGGFTQDVTVGGHHLLADEPVSYGGNYLGPTPYQYLAAGLGACTSMTIRMYAQRKKLPLEHVQVDVTHDKVHAEDCTDCEQKSGKVDRFERKITLIGELSEAERQRLMQIADNCPVHRTLEGDILIVTSLV